MKRKAFTLVELLIVVAIIALVIAIILPMIRPGGARPHEEYKGNGIYLLSGYGYDTSVALSQFKHSHPNLRVISFQSDPTNLYHLIVNTEEVKLPLEKP